MFEITCFDAETISYRRIGLKARVRRWLRIRRWRTADHDDCLSFMGPCQFCRERLDHLRSGAVPVARVVSR